MTTATIAVTALAAVLLLIGYLRGRGEHIKGVTAAVNLFRGLLPLLLTAFLFAGLLEASLPPSLVRAWLGEGSGIRGVLIGSLGGAMIPGGPYVAFPIIASLYKAGVSLATAVAFITGWAMCSVGTIAYEIPFLGPRFTAVRMGLSLVFPPLAGILAGLLFGSL